LPSSTETKRRSAVEIAAVVCRLIARRSPDVVGSPWTFLFVLLASVVWLALGPPLGFSDAWLLVPSAGASIVALLLVVLLQYSQNRDTRAIQLKLDELIRGLDRARTHLVRLEQLSDEELEEMEREFQKLREDEAG
jgi:low affinity Fe/Cu permease